MANNVGDIIGMKYIDDTEIKIYIAKEGWESKKS